MPDKKSTCVGSICFVSINLKPKIACQNDARAYSTHSRSGQPYLLIKCCTSASPYFVHRSPHIKRPPDPSHNKRVSAASPPPRGGSSGFARASCAPRRARPCGLNQIRPPSKTQAFLGRSNFANARALCERGPGRRGFLIPTIPVSGSRLAAACR